MADADDSEVEVVAADAGFGAHAIGGIEGDAIAVVDADEAGSARELPFAAACRQYTGRIGFGDIGIIRQLVLAEPTGKDAVALRDLIKSVIKHTPPEVALYDSERAQHLASLPEEWRAGARDRLDYDRRVFEFYAIALMRLELRILCDPRKAIVTRQRKGRAIMRRIAAGGA